MAASLVAMFVVCSAAKVVTAGFSVPVEARASAPLATLCVGFGNEVSPGATPSLTSHISTLSDEVMTLPPSRIGLVAPVAVLQADFNLDIVARGGSLGPPNKEPGAENLRKSLIWKSLSAAANRNCDATWVTV
jgi:mRNA-degrading endonuclease toxin of MazEF toxin-antitoxin module